MIPLSLWQQQSLADAKAAAASVQANHPDYPPALAPVSIAQFILESDWGARAMADAHNYFGIKARNGQPFISRTTREFIGGRWTTVTARFAIFSSMESCFEAHAALLCEGRWHENGALIYADALSHPTDAEAFAHALTGVYATDPNYGAKLVAIMRENELLNTAT